MMVAAHKLPYPPMLPYSVYIGGGPSGCQIQKVENSVPWVHRLTVVQTCPDYCQMESVDLECCTALQTRLIKSIASNNILLATELTFWALSSRNLSSLEPEILQLQLVEACFRGMCTHPGKHGWQQDFACETQSCCLENLFSKCILK